MNEHSNVASHRSVHEAFSRGDMDFLAGIMVDEVVFHWSGKSQISGDHRGREAVFGVLAKLAELTDGNLELVDHDVMGNDEHTTALSIVTATRGDKTLEYRFCETIHWSNGQAVEEWIFFEDQYAVDEFWA